MSNPQEILNSIWGTDIDSLQSKASGNFGLNTGFLTKFEINEKAGKDGADGIALDMTVKINDKEYYNRFFMNKELYYKNELITPDNENYAKAFLDTYVQYAAVIKHTLKSVGVTDVQLNAVPKTTATDNNTLVDRFVVDVKNMLALLPAGFNTKPVDIFLEYQWNIVGDNDQTYLVLPKNLKGGYFIIPASQPVGKWTEVKNEEGLHYIDDAGNRHPFDRSNSYMESNKANQQTKNATPTVNMSNTAGTPSTWD